MSHRLLIPALVAAVIVIAGSGLLRDPALASELLASHFARSAGPPAGHPDEKEAARLRQRLSAQGYQSEGGFRRRGDNLLTEALRSGGRWRVVVDSRSGEVVGVRLIGPAVDLARSD